MINTALNIGSEIGVLNKLPITNSFKTIRDFIDFTRTSSPYFVEWALKKHISPSKLELYIIVTQDIPSEPNSIWENSFIIKCKNIREYSQIMNLKKEEIESIIRDDIINSVLES